MKRQSLWIVPALALALAAPAVAQNNDNEKEKNQNRARREQIYGDDDYRYNDNGRLGNNGNMRFRGMDRNGDGRITRREWNGNDKSFRMHDANHDGVLSGREVWTGNRNNGTVYDNRNGGIYDNRNGGIFGDRNNRVSFGSLDRNNDGVLEGREWPYGATVFNQLDRNNNRVIENWEFRNQ